MDRQILYQHKLDYLSDPNKVFTPTVFEHLKQIPKLCPYDGNPITFHRVFDLGVNGFAPCCLACNRLFVIDEFKRMDKRTRERLIFVRNEVALKQVLKCVSPQLNLPIKIIDPPKSTIIVAMLYADTKGPKRKRTKIGELAIVANHADQNASAGIYWVGRELPSRILAAIKLDPNKRVRYKNKWYRVSYQYDHKRPYIKDRYLEIITRFCDPSNPHVAFLFQHSKRAQYEQLGEYVMAMVPCVNETFPVPIPSIFSKESKNYYIDEEIYANAARKHGLPWIQPIDCVTFDDTDGPKFSTFKKRSVLNLLGYSVSSYTGPSLEARRKLLTALIDGEIMSGYAIRKHLWTLIDINKGRESMVEAVEEWRSDIEFLMEYEARNHDSVWVNAFWSAKDGIISTSQFDKDP